MENDMYARHSKMIFYFLLSKISDYDVAEELTQETFYQAVKSINSFSGKSSVSTWLYAIAENVWRSWLRKQKNKPIISIEDKAYADLPVKNTLINWDEKEILKHIHYQASP